MHLDYIEIGTSDFDALVLDDNDLVGISIEPLQIYTEKLPNKKNNKKINVAISDFDGYSDFFYVEPTDIDKYDLPFWIKGCNSINDYHPSVLEILREKNLMSLYRSIKVKTITWDTLVRTENITSVEFLKIDAEGHDCIILENVINSQTNILPKKIKFEANSLTSSNKINNTLNLLIKRGYVVSHKDNEGIIVELTEKIVNKIIFASDSNPDFIDFWPINSELCSKKLGVTPVLFHICEEESDFYWDNYGIVKKIKRVSDNPGFEAQIYRMYGTKYFMNEICMTSDIDMLLFNKDYVKNHHFEKESVTILNSDAYDSKRPECVGIYGSNRYPICYIVATGNVFNKILNTDVEFQEYHKRLLEMNLGYDTDEIYFGNSLIQSNVKTTKIKRGYSSSFHCPNRIEKYHFTNESEFFKLNLNGFVSVENFIDCHCARPYSQHKSKIKNIVSQLIKIDGSGLKEVFLIGCHIENENQEKLLRELVEFLEKNNKEFVLSSHTPIPQDIIEKSVGFIYDSANPVYKTWELDNYPKFYFETNDFKILSPYVSYGAINYYHVGAIKLINNGVKYLLSTDYDIINWVEYDTIPDLKLLENNKHKFYDYDFVFYGIGSLFSFRKSKVNLEFNSLKGDEILNILSKNDYLAENVLSKMLVDGKKHQVFLDDTQKGLWGRYSQCFNNNKINWCLLEIKEEIQFFITSLQEQNTKVEIKVDGNYHFFDVKPGNWILYPISQKEQIGIFELFVDGLLEVKIDLSNKKTYNQVIHSNSLISK